MSQWVPVIILLVVFVLGVLLLTINWGNLFGRVFRYKPWCGKIFLDSGVGIEQIDGDRIYNGPEGDIYSYQYQGKRHEVRTGPKYPHKPFQRGRLIKAKPGNLYAQPLFEGDLAEPNFSEAESGVIENAYLMVELNKSIHGKSLGSLALFLIIGVVIVAIIGGVLLSRRGGSPPAPTPTPTPTQQAPGSNIKPIPTGELFNRLVEVS